MATYSGEYPNGDVEGVPNKSSGWGSDIVNMIDKVSDEAETRRRDDEFEHETSSAFVFSQTIALFLHTFFMGMAYTLSATIEPILWSVPTTSEQSWVAAAGKTLVFFILCTCVQFSSQAPGYMSILSCIRAPAFAVIYAESGRRCAVFTKSLFTNIWYIAVIFGTWCLVCTFTAYWNQGVWGNIGYPPFDMHAGYYDAYLGNFTWIMLVVGLTEYIDGTLQHRRFYSNEKGETASKLWHWPASPFSYYFNKANEEWTTKLLSGRFFILYVLFNSFLDIGLLVTAPIFDTRNRSSLGFWIGAVLAGWGASVVLMIVANVGIIGRNLWEKRFLAYNKPEPITTGETTGTNELAATSANGRGRKTPTVHKLASVKLPRSMHSN